jgi:hypothetical protein
VDERKSNISVRYTSRSSCGIYIRKLTLQYEATLIVFFVLSDVYLFVLKGVLSIGFVLGDKFTLVNGTSSHNAPPFSFDVDNL